MFMIDGQEQGERNFSFLRFVTLLLFTVAGTLSGWFIAATFTVGSPIFTGQRGLWLVTFALMMAAGGALGAGIAARWLMRRGSK